MATATAQRQQAFQPKAAEKVVYRLIKQNEKTREDTPLYRPLIILQNTDTISENGQLRNIRYIKGHKSIYVEDQEEGNRPLPENLVHNQQNKIQVVDGFIEVSPKDKTLIEFLDKTNKNQDSKFRYGNTTPLFKRVTEDTEVDERLSKQDLVEQALKLAASADDIQLEFHAKYLEIPILDPYTNASRSIKAIKADYKQTALDSPKKFIDSFNDPELKTRYWLDRAVNEKTIDINTVVGQAIWGSSKAEICAIPSGTDHKNIMETLFVFALSKNGGDLLKQLKEKYA